ncbi:uncharacterized protein LOC124209338 isoform X2 [Daphnia pulex]|uniref:uncharacterized protein LOC124209338 isoform X2 n=1 Tax=Daphnia pulex TaxID=6669 RepID=UPI001EDFFE03|nr:uncharacterized protein LOC124209338 isoform X2 [Daphnia pulex]
MAQLVGNIMEDSDWYIERLGNQISTIHLNILLGTREKLTIGREAGDDIDIVCNGKFVSREHCVLKYIDKSWSIEDLKSTNGVYHGIGKHQKRIPANTRTILREGDVFSLGAMEATEQDAFVFIVLKNSEDDKVCLNYGDHAVAEAPCVSAAQSLCDPLEESLIMTTSDKYSTASNSQQLNSSEHFKQTGKINLQTKPRILHSLAIPGGPSRRETDSQSTEKANHHEKLQSKHTTQRNPVAQSNQMTDQKRKYCIDSFRDDLSKKSRCDSSVDSVNEANKKEKDRPPSVTHSFKKPLVRDNVETSPLLVPENPKLNSLPDKTSYRPVDREALMNDILHIICNWRYDWIENEKETENKHKLPPLLDSLRRENSCIRPELSLLPVQSSYASVESYSSTFTPLMLEELWASICNDVETREPEVFTTLIHPKPEFCDGFALLRCETLSRIMISNMDLVALDVHISPQEPPVKIFAVAERLDIKHYWKSDQIDSRLLEIPQCLNFPLKSFFLRMEMSRVPRNLDKFFTVTTVSRLNTVVKQFILNAELARSPLCEVILRPSDCEDAFQLDAVDLESQAVLNPVQHEVVESFSRTVVFASENQPRVALLHGPPDRRPGQTTTDIPRILVCAPSNNAIDEIANRLLIARDSKIGYDIIRIGVKASMHPDVQNISLDKLTENIQRADAATRISPESGKLQTLCEELKSLRQEMNNLITLLRTPSKMGLLDEAEKEMHGSRLEQINDQIEVVNRSYDESLETHFQYFNSKKERPGIRKHLLSHAQIICSTLNSCRSREMEELFLEHQGSSPFLCCILDEASQCTEPESITPLAFGITKLILIGDPKQLPATVLSKVAQKKGFAQSLFNRFYSVRDENKDGVIMLTTQYRMVSSICEWPSRYFYAGKLETDESLIRNGPCHEYRVLNVVDGQELREEQSFRNQQEAAVVARIVRLFLDSPLNRWKSIGVITFYKSQKLCIIEQLKKVGIKSNCSASTVDVNTVDSFQGREKDIIVISCVRASSQAEENLVGSIGFITSLSRINVSVTRAKEMLVICGHFLTLQRDGTWRDLISDASSRNVAHDVSRHSSCEDLRSVLMRAPANESTIVNQVVHQQMVASFAEQSGMDSNWSFKCLEDCGWDYYRAAYVFTELKGTFKIPLAAFIEPKQQQQEMVASFSEKSGIDSRWSFKFLEDCGWDYYRAAHVFTELKGTFKIPLAAFIAPEQQQQEMVASFSEKSGIDSRWSFKFLEDCGWDYDRAAYVFTELKGTFKIPLAAFIEPEQQQQEMVASFSEKSGMDSNWSLNCLKDNGWVYDSAAYRFNLLQRTFKIPLAAFIEPEQQQQQMIASFSEQSRMDSRWSFKCLEDCGWDYDLAAYVFIELKAAGEIPPEAFVK